ncbi:MAG: YbgA family protein [bacterium]
MAPNKIRLGISSCLLGEKVRYDGQHKLDRYLRDTLGQFVEWVPVCPEVECGLPVPREAMRLVGDLESPHLVTRKTGIDYTEQMLTWARQKLKELEKQELCGFIFKSKSPSSGMRNVKVYKEPGSVTPKGIGLFAREFMRTFPLLPVEDEGRLHDAALRENFIERIFVYQRWRELLYNRKSLHGLSIFHGNHKLLTMSHSPQLLRELGALVAGGKKMEQDTLFSRYITTFMAGLIHRATIKKNTNVLQHIMGYFKKNITTDEKSELLEVIDNYHKGYIPLIVPIVLLQHYVRKYKEPYLQKQYYLHPHPLELMLRNHV